jgi:hypothetical protein
MASPEEVEKESAGEAPTSASSQAISAVLGSPYNPLNYIDESGKWLGDKAADLGAPPAVSTALRVAPDAAAALMGFRKGGSAGGPATMAEPAAAEDAVSPRLRAAAETETARNAAVRQAGVEAGLDLPDNPTPERAAQAAVTNQRRVPALIKRQLRLPEDAPLTLDENGERPMLEEARAENGFPAYERARKEGPIYLQKSYENEIKQIDPEDFASIKKAFRPPTAGVIDANTLVDRVRYLRARASKLFDSANRGIVENEDPAHAHWDAANALEDALEEHYRGTGRPELANDLANGRKYIAQTYTLQQALTPAGDLNAPLLTKRLMKGKPMEGAMGMVGQLAARNPDLFSLKPPNAPAPGLLRRGAAAIAPTAATAAGAFAFGVPGAVGGKLAGESLRERLLSPQK